MKILMLVNWKVLSCKETPNDKQPPDYRVEGEPYWFYRYFNQKDDVDIIDISSVSWLENFEREKLRFYVLQALKAIPKLHKYDLIVSHGMQSAVVVCLYRRFFRGKEKHIVFDIGSFNSAAESGSALKLMQFIRVHSMRIMKNFSHGWLKNLSLSDLEQMVFSGKRKQTPKRR